MFSFRKSRPRCTGFVEDWRRRGPLRSRAAWLLALSLALAAPQIVGQTSSSSTVSEYTSAVARVQPADRIRDLQRFAWNASGQLRVDALEFIVWEYWREGNRAHALTWGNELQAADKDNALALALICEPMRAPTLSKAKADQLLDTAQRGINALPQLRRPLGMSEPDFTRLRQQTLARLKGAAGYAELQRKNNLAARNNLREAVALDPGRADDLYALALANLNGKNPDRKEGYWDLARAVELSRGSPQGTQIAQYARGRYVDDGGTNAGWDQFLVAAAAANRGLAPKTRTTVTDASLANQPSREARATAQQPIAKAATPKSSSIAKAPNLPSSAGRTNSSSKSATTDTATYTPPVIRPHRVSSGPISLGILIETSLTQQQSRSSVVSALTDMLRHMSDDDEAFILTYDNHLVFEQDLTTDPQQLDEAMKNIKPEKGAVLDEAVAFAASHLARIAKYPNRVLLVISDGRNVGSHDSPARTSAQINAAGVRIYCIGMKVSELDGRYRLQALSSSTGGRSEFVSDPGQFRQATKQIAQNMGIDFRF